MNAKQMISRLDGYGGIIPFNSEELDITLRALRLLAAAEDNDWTKAEVLPSFIAIHLCSDYTRGKCGDPAYDDCCCQKLVRGYEQINNERNGLAARVGELEAKVRLLNIFKGCAMDAIEAHEITNQGDSDVIGVLIGIAARSKP